MSLNLQQNLTQKRWQHQGLPVSERHRFILWDFDSDNNTRIITRIYDTGCGIVGAIMTFNTMRKQWAIWNDVAEVTVEALL